MECSVIDETQQMPLLCKRNPVSWTHTQHHGHQTTAIKDPGHQQHASTKTAKQVCVFLGLIGYYWKFIKNFVRIAIPLTLLTHHKVKFKWTPAHHAAFMTLKEVIIQAPILHCHDPAKKYIVYMDASDDVCGTQLSQEQDVTKFPAAFLSHTLAESQRKWSIPEQETYGVY